MDRRHRREARAYAQALSHSADLFAVTLTAYEGFQVFADVWDGDGITCWRQALLDLRFLCGGEPTALKNVVGESVEEHDSADLFDAAHDQLPQIPVSPAGMDAFAD